MSKNAVVLRKGGISHGDAHHAQKSIIRNMDDGQFNDWRGAGIVREATAADLAGTKPKQATPAKPKPRSKPKPVAKPAPALAVDTIPGAKPE